MSLHMSLGQSQEENFSNDSQESLEDSQESHDGDESQNGGAQNDRFQWTVGNRRLLLLQSFQRAWHLPRNRGGTGSKRSLKDSGWRLVAQLVSEAIRQGGGGNVTLNFKQCKHGWSWLLYNRDAWKMITELRCGAFVALSSVSTFNNLSHSVSFVHESFVKHLHITVLGIAPCAEFALNVSPAVVLIYTCLVVLCFSQWFWQQ